MLAPGLVMALAAVGPVADGFDDDPVDAPAIQRRRQASGFHLTANDIALGGQRLDRFAEVQVVDQALTAEQAADAQYRPDTLVRAEALGFIDLTHGVQPSRRGLGARAAQCGQAIRVDLAAVVGHDVVRHQHIAQRLRLLIDAEGDADGDDCQRIERDAQIVHRVLRRQTALRAVAQVEL